MNGGKFTSSSEIAAYLAAHILGIGTAYVVNPIIFSGLIVAGYQTYVPAVALGISLLIMLVVLLVFLAMRSAFGGGALQR
jgi:hypothetical protein